MARYRRADDLNGYGIYQMIGLAKKLADAKAEVADLERQIASASCAAIGKHEWRTIGGAWCGCPDGGCSVPVYDCLRCGACDYGDNIEADAIRAKCAGDD